MVILRYLKLYSMISPLNLWSFGAFQVAHFAHFAHFDMANHRPRPELCIAHGVLHVARMRRFASSSAQQAQRYLQRKKRWRWWFYGDFIVISITRMVISCEYQWVYNDLMWWNMGVPQPFWMGPSWEWIMDQYHNRTNVWWNNGKLNEPTRGETMQWCWW